MQPVDPTKGQERQALPETPATPIEQLTADVANVSLGNDRPTAPSNRTYQTPEGRYQLPDDHIMQELNVFEMFFKPPGQVPTNPK